MNVILERSLSTTLGGPGTSLPSPTKPEVEPSPLPIPVEDPPVPEQPVEPPAFLPREDPGADPTPACPEGTPDSDPREFETCLSSLKFPASDVL